MRILLLNTSFPPMARSASHLYYDLARYLLNKGHEISVLTEIPWRRFGNYKEVLKYKKAYFKYHELMDGIEVIRVRGFPFKENSIIGRGFNSISSPFFFFLFGYNYHKFDVALVYSPPLTLGITAILIKKIYSCPFVLNVQDIYPQTLIDLGILRNKFLIYFFEKIEKYCYSKADKIVVHSDGNQEYLMSRKKVPSENISVIPNFIDTNFIKPLDKYNYFRRRYGLENKFIICYAGTMGYAQDLMPFIEAAKRLQMKNDIVFLFIGEGVRKKEWTHKSEREGIKNIIFLPLQPREIYPYIVSASDIGIVPLSNSVKTPVVPGKLLDFMSGARAVIATTSLDNDTSKIIQDAQCGYSFYPDQVSEIVKAILYLYEHQDIRIKMGLNGRRYIEDNFSLEICGKKFETLFYEIINRRNK